jgi:[acyl-carrier-protein] S-malonyltransferase
MRLGYIFPGQGVQYVGMGHDLYENFEIAKQLFQKANEVLKFDITRLCFFGPIEELIKTENCQPAIFLVSVIALKCLEEYFKDRLKQGYKNWLNPYAASGLSLGEYAALVATESISFEDGLKLVRERGQLMEESARENKGAMTSIIGLKLAQVEDLARNTGVEIANINSPGQIVVSGRLDAIERAEKLAKEKGVKKVIRLNVAGAFHSSLMDSASKKLMVYLQDLRFSLPKFNLISNVNAFFARSAQEIKANLVNQLNHATLWEDTVHVMVDSGITTFLELGPGKTLKGLLRRIDPMLLVYNIETSVDIKNFYQELVVEEENGSS